MTAPVQVNEFSAAAADTTAGVTQTSDPTLGNTNVVWVRGPSGATVSGVADSQGNTYTAQGNVTEAGTGQVLYQFTAPITSSGANTVTATYGASTTNRGIYVLEGAGTFDVANTGTDTGNNPTGTVSATNTAQPATVLMLANDVQGGTPGVGTGFTNVGTGWATLGLNCRVQYKEVTSVGSQSGNFANASFDRVNSGLVILLDFVPPAITLQPVDQATTEGGTASFDTTVTGATSYQWERLPPLGGSWANVSGGSGGTTADYTTPALSRASDAGALYRLKATNSSGDTYSNTVGVRITDAPATYAFGGLVIGSSNSFVGESVIGAIDSAAASSTAAWSSVGTSSATFAGASSVVSAWNSVAAATATWRGASLTASVWASAGAGSASFVGSSFSIAAGAFSSAGSGTAAWASSSSAAGAWQSTGAGTAAWRASAQSASAWSASGAGTASWVGDAIGGGATVASGDWNAVGVSTASITGASVTTGAWSATGSGSASWEGGGSALSQGAFTSAGASTATLSGASFSAAAWNAAGVATMLAAGAATASGAWASAASASATWDMRDSSVATVESAAFSIAGTSSVRFVGRDASAQPSNTVVTLGAQRAFKERSTYHPYGDTYDQAIREDAELLAMIQQLVPIIEGNTNAFHRN